MSLGQGQGGASRRLREEETLVSECSSSCWPSARDHAELTDVGGTWSLWCHQGSSGPRIKVPAEFSLGSSPCVCQVPVEGLPSTPTAHLQMAAWVPASCQPVPGTCWGGGETLGPALLPTPPQAAPLTPGTQTSLRTHTEEEDVSAPPQGRGGGGQPGRTTQG